MKNKLKYIVLGIVLIAIYLLTSNINPELSTFSLSLGVAIITITAIFKQSQLPRLFTAALLFVSTFGISQNQSKFKYLEWGMTAEEVIKEVEGNTNYITTVDSSRSTSSAPFLILRSHLDKEYTTSDYPYYEFYIINGELEVMYEYIDYELRKQLAKIVLKDTSFTFDRGKSHLSYTWDEIDTIRKFYIDFKSKEVYINYRRKK